ncbi:glycoside-pentoside-hexuronide (GPH):cation symporter [Paenibacillus sp. MZ04-78.2]|uniref:MFS transporter n=1 Tax=Paenibacillus sp. MZ04-78.2 TaxID=2962034 RepID=UPI0020B89856|nr:glycoside-pentoside-hexuronide (GPH):cation symporter [Paenibacillus sp. MZ04-78.2]MCP3774468.1 glycoside-pentoside-hexuronide (GPH):cation symporter [Paenibacillus sp. MZ04-78.2]
MNDKLSLKEKVSYGLGDLASNFVWGMITSYLLYFYTNVYGLAAGVVGTLFLITRILDAIIDPFIGVLIDKTKTKHGKTRPYLLYVSVPFAVLSVITFITPNISEGGKLVYAYLTYLVLGILYSAINVPYGALMPLMTKNSDEKTQLGSFRMMGMALGAIIVSACTQPLVQAFGGGDEKVGYPITMTVYAVVGMILFYIVFKNCKERFDNSGLKSDESVGKSLLNLLKNRPWVMIALNSLFLFLRLGTMFGVLVYFVTYVLEQPYMVPLYLTLANVATFVGGAVAPFILKPLGKRNGSILVLSASIILFVMMIFLENGSPVLYLLLFFIANTLIGIHTPANFAMLADTADYHEWKFGQRTEGTLYSAYSFATKFGSAVGASFVAYALGWVNYDPNHLTDSAVSMIRTLMYVGPIAFTALQIVFLVMYKLDKQHPSIMRELNNKTYV